VVTELVVPTSARPEPASAEAGTPLPHDVFEIFVNALADALVLDYQQDMDAMVGSPQGKADDGRRGGA
jgi:hypothetical protein